MAKRQIARSIQDAIAREAEGERADGLTHAPTERLDSLDTENEFPNRSAGEIIAIIRRDLGLDPARMTLRSPLPNAISRTTPNQAPLHPLDARDPAGTPATAPARRVVAPGINLANPAAVAAPHSAKAAADSPRRRP